MREPVDCGSADGGSVVGSGAAWVLPAPVPYGGVDRCVDCGGAGVTGWRYRWPGDGQDELLVDEICLTCKGCGRDERHVGCVAAQHFDWDPRDDFDDDIGEELSARTCPSCWDRPHWNAVTGFSHEGERVTSVRYLRVPCGCAESLLVAVEGPL